MGGVAADVGEAGRGPAGGLAVDLGHPDRGASDLDPDPDLADVAVQDVGAMPRGSHECIVESCCRRSAPYVLRHSPPRCDVRPQARVVVQPSLISHPDAVTAGDVAEIGRDLQTGHPPRNPIGVDLVDEACLGRRVGPRLCCRRRDGAHKRDGHRDDGEPDGGARDVTSDLRLSAGSGGRVCSPCTPRVDPTWGFLTKSGWSCAERDLPRQRCAPGRLVHASSLVRRSWVWPSPTEDRSPASGLVASSHPPTPYLPCASTTAWPHRSSA